MPSASRFPAIVMTLLVWGFSGGIFGALFAGLHGVLGLLGLSGWQPAILATAAAAMTTSAFYSAMPLALTGAMAGILGSIAYLIAGGHSPDLTTILIVAGGAGAIAGSFQAWLATGSGRPLAETLTGLMAGLVAGGLLALLTRFVIAEPGMAVMAAGVVALVGTVFQISERWLVARVARRVPGTLAAPAVAGLVASVVGAGVWLMGGATDVMFDDPARDSIQRLLHEVPPGFLGGLAGGIVTGVLLELLGFRLEDRR